MQRMSLSNLPLPETLEVSDSTPLIDAILEPPSPLVDSIMDADNQPEPEPPRRACGNCGRFHGRY